MILRWKWLYLDLLLLLLTFCRITNDDFTIFEWHCCDGVVRFPSDGNDLLSVPSKNLATAEFVALCQYLNNLVDMFFTSLFTLILFSILFVLLHSVRSKAERMFSLLHSYIVFPIAIMGAMTRSRNLYAAAGLVFTANVLVTSLITLRVRQRTKRFRLTSQLCKQPP